MAALHSNERDVIQAGIAKLEKAHTSDQIEAAAHDTLLNLINLRYGTTHKEISRLSKDSGLEKRRVIRYVEGQFNVAYTGGKVMNNLMDGFLTLAQTLVEDPELQQDAYMCFLGYPGYRSPDLLVHDFVFNHITREPMLKRMRLQTGISQEGLSETLGLHKERVMLIEGGHHLKKSDDARRYGYALGVTDEAINDFVSITTGRYTQRSLGAIYQAIDEGVASTSDKERKTALRKVNRMIHEQSGKTIAEFVAQFSDATDGAFTESLWEKRLMGVITDKDFVPSSISRLLHFDPAHAEKYRQLSLGICYKPETLASLDETSDAATRVQAVKTLMRNVKVTKEIAMRETGISRHQWDQFAKTGQWHKGTVSIQAVADLLVPRELGASHADRERFTSIFTSPPAQDIAPPDDNSPGGGAGPGNRITNPPDRRERVAPPPEIGKRH